MKDLMMFQKVQMGELPQTAVEGSVVSSMNKKNKPGKKAHIGGPMGIEEIRMNKGLLKEINKMKKEQGLTQRGRSPNKDPNTDI